MFYSCGMGPPLEISSSNTVLGPRRDATKVKEMQTATEALVAPSLVVKTASFALAVAS